MTDTQFDDLKELFIAREERMTEDFKQLLETTIWGSEKRIKIELTDELGSDISELRSDMASLRLETLKTQSNFRTLTQRLDDGFAAVADAFEDLSDFIDRRTLPTSK